MKKRVVVTGIGAITPIGIGIKEYWAASLRGDSGTDDITLFDASNYQTKIAAEVKGFDPAAFMLPEIYRKVDRFAQFGIAAAKMALDDAGLENQYDKVNNNIQILPTILKLQQHKLRYSLYWFRLVCLLENTC